LEYAPGGGHDQHGFDRLPGVAILELGGAQVADRLMTFALLAALAPVTTEVPQLTRGELQAAVRSAVGPEAAMARSCFAAAARGPVAARLGAAAVSLTGIDFEEGAVTAGSGVIVADSASPENPFNKILTASIVSRSRGAALKVEVVDSTGALVGWAEEVAAGAEADAKGTLATAALLPRVVVLAVAVFVPGQETRYAALSGAPLASAPFAGQISGVVAAPAGLAPQSLGAGVADPAGRLLGVLTWGLDDAALPRKHVRAPVLAVDPDSAQAGVFVAPDAATGLLPARSRAWATGLGDPDVLAALGATGKAAIAEASDRAAALNARGKEVPVRIAGFPFGRCVVYAARMGSPGSTN
jgi:hypothetical protein